MPVSKYSDEELIAKIIDTASRLFATNDEAEKELFFRSFDRLMFEAQKRPATIAYEIQRQVQEMRGK